MIDDEYMSLALEQAMLAEAAGEVPVGAILVLDGEVIVSAGNAPIGLHDPSAHAEIQVMRAAGQALQNYRLNNTTLYVTLEPCAMCAGALVNARVGRLVYGAQDFKAGACGTVYDLVRSPELNHRMNVRGGVREDECRKLLQDFFRERRSKPSPQ
ncbi:MAG: tRNA(adenine34) deaminase [Gammaproteobacteria bacterium]|jgi:tRNA(adenine34) deaminase